MNMKNHILIAGLLLAGCAKSGQNIQTDVPENMGRVAFQTTAAVDVITRATAELPSECIPAAEAFDLRVEGADDSVIYDGPFGRYDYEFTYLPAGNYTATVTCGDPEAEGPDAFTYEGTRDFTVVARKTTTETITARLTNAAVSISTGEWFGNYYPDAALTVHTDDHNFRLTPGQVVFVKPGTALYISGSAVKQTGARVTFDKTQIGTAVARTWHTLEVELQEVGNGGLTIEFDDEMTNLPEETFELNPEA